MMGVVLQYPCQTLVECLLETRTVCVKEVGHDGTDFMGVSIAL